MVFLTSEENRIVILLATWPPCLGRRKDLRKNLRKDYFGFLPKKKNSFSNEKHQKERRTALTFYLAT